MVFCKAIGTSIPLYDTNLTRYVVSTPKQEYWYTEY